MMSDTILQRKRIILQEYFLKFYVNIVEERKHSFFGEIDGLQLDERVGGLTLNEQTNQELVRQVQTGKQSAFEELVKRYQKSVFNIAYRIVCNRALAEDIAQETFLKAWKAIPKYRPKAKFTIWLFKIAKNTCFDMLRKTKRQPTVTLKKEMLMSEKHPCGASSAVVSMAPASADTIFLS